MRDVVFCGLDGERLIEVDEDPLIGATVDRYKIRRILGDGGMARVYEAEHIHLAQPVALKILFGDMAADRTLAERFRREAQSSAQIKHPNVVDVRDFGVSQSGLSFMAMELLAGPTLSELARPSRRLAPPKIAEIVRQTCLGLGAAHRLGFIHRDLKPKNLMIVPVDGNAEEQRVKILDFGLVRPLEDKEARLTVAGQVFGTPAYMSPEQIQDGTIDARTDLYALGIIIYELLSGKAPFTGPMSEVFKKHMSLSAPPLADRSGLGELAQVLMAKSPSARPASAEEVVEIIDSLGLTIISGKALISKPPLSRPPDPSQAPTPPALAKPTKNLRGTGLSFDPPSEPGFDDEALSSEPGRKAGDTADSSVDGELERAAIEAMAERAKPAWPRRAAFVLGLGLALFGAWRALGPSLLKDTPSPSPSPVIAAPDPKTSPKPTHAGTSTETIAILTGHRPRKTDPSPSTTSTAPIELPDLASHLQAFRTLDAELIAKLGDRGFGLEDLRPYADDEVALWVRFRGAPDDADREEGLRTQAALFDAADRVRLDKEFFARKTARIRQMLEDAPKKDEEWKAQEARANALSAAAQGAHPTPEDAALARNLSLLEAELEAAK
ncbi:MAG: serine/threonine-protein kinase [Myxococcota bacterium]